jgi:3-hydroxyisobutyrate dehydrogenase-like beta-hydroxyacid dehydrogenase
MSGAETSSGTHATVSKVGFIGVGQMGVRMARRIAGAGHGLVVHDADACAAAPLVEEGAEWAATPQAVAEACRAVITCLPTPQIVEEVVLGPGGVRAGWRPGDVYVDMSTNSPAVIRRIAAEAATSGVAVLDAPVSGGTRGAEAGTLTIMVGGPAQALEQVRAVLEPMANRIFHLGDVGCGNVAKLVNNMIGLACTAVSAEGFVLAAKAGIDPLALQELLVISTADNWAVRQFPKTIFADDFAPGFKISLAYKDINLALDLGEEFAVPLAVGEATKAELERALEAGLGEQGVDAIIRPLEDEAAVKVRRRKG